MPWLRIDDVYDTHPKLLELTEVERWRWTRVLIHCARYRTGGRVTESVITELQLTRSLRKLIDVRLLAKDGRDYVVHDWHAYNGGTLEERVAAYLEDNPEASANDVARAVPGSRKSVLRAVRDYHTNGDGGGSDAVH